MPRQQRSDIEFLRAVKTEMRLRDFLPKQAICADNARLVLAEAVARHVIDDDKMIANLVEATNVPSRKGGLGIWRRAAFLEENLVSKFLRLADFGLLHGNPQLKRARPSHGRSETGV
ncbi:hypothetical protein GGD83_004266 [Rhodoblastus sphagnicola]|nr:hypothetical protein [Rhodoblastus sphagnicola]